MTRAFTQYWRADALAGLEALPFRHTASNEFLAKGLGPGDRIYLVSARRGELLLVATGLIDAIVTRAEAMRRLGLDNLWEAREHVLIRPGTGTPLRPVPVPAEVVEALRFFDPVGREVPLKFRAPGRLDPQTLRAIRRLTPASAALLAML